MKIFSLLLRRLLTLVFLLGLGTSSALAGNGPIAEAATPDLAALLNPDGSLRPGARGSFNATGYTMQMAPDGRPAFRPVGASRTQGVGDDMWSPYGSQPTYTGYRFVFAVAADGNGNVYVGGLFSSMGGAGANNVAKWNGTSWSSLGQGTNDVVYALTIDNNGNLYAGGNFTAAGGATATRVAKWNGTAWSDMGGGFVNLTVFALLADNSGNLYMGGGFFTTNGPRYLAKWNGSYWLSLGAPGFPSYGQGPNGPVYALALKSNGHLFIGGNFNVAGSVLAAGVAEWDGSNWSALGAGIVGQGVYALLFTPAGDLYAGGNFGTAGGTSISNIAKWDGAAWSAVGSGLNNTVQSLDLDGSGNLYAGGQFTGNGYTTLNRLAKWNGTVWSALGTGTNGTVYGVAVRTNNLIVAGNFTACGDGSVRLDQVAKYQLYYLPPTLSSFSPSSAQANATITLTGTNLTGTTAVAFNGTAATAFTVNATGTQIAVTLPATATSGLVRVTTPGGTATSAANFTVIPPAPSTYGTTYQGFAGNTITFYGFNLLGVTTITFTGTNNNTVTSGFSINSQGNQITGVVVPTGAQTGYVTVTGPGGSSGPSTSAYFTLRHRPVLDNTYSYAASAGTTFTLRGSYLQGTTTVAFSGTSNNVATSGFNVNSYGSAILNVPVPSGATSGPLTVTTPDGISNTVNFTLYPPPPPTIGSFSPTSGSIGDSIIINGANYNRAANQNGSGAPARFSNTAVSGVAFNGTPAAFRVVSATQLKAAVPTSASTGPITVTSSTGTATSTTQFIVMRASSLPTITSFSPAYAKPGDALTITGQNLSGLTDLSISGVSQTAYTVNAAGTQITTTVPGSITPLPGSGGIGEASSPIGTGRIAVTTPDGTATSATRLRIFNVTGFYDHVQGYNSPAGPLDFAGNYYVSGGDQVYLRGSGFLGATGAKIDFHAFLGNTCGNELLLNTSLTVLNDSMLYVVYQPSSLAGAPFNNFLVGITTSLGTLAPTYTPPFPNSIYDVSPVASCLSPASGGPGTRVTVAGVLFNNNPSPYQNNTATGLAFNGVAGLNVTTNTASFPPSISADLPAGLTPGLVQVQVTGTGYFTNNPNVLLGFTLSGPVIASLSPVSGPVGTSLTITGTDLTGATAITLAGSSNNTVTSGFTVNAAGTQITGVVVPTGTATGPVTVTTAGGTSNGVAFTVTAPAALTIVGTSPAANARAASASGPVAVTFNQAVTGGSTAALRVFSAQRGGLRSGYSGSTTASGSAVSFAPTYGFKPGELVQATVTTAATAAAGGGLAAARVVQFTAAAGAGPGTFSGGSDPAVGNYPYAVTAADVDNDGNPDLLTANANDNTVSVRLNNGSGSFGGTTNLAVGARPYGVTAADVNGDGYLDLLTANQNANTASVCLGNGSGSFGAASSVPVGSGPWGVATADVDGDGDLDLLTANHSTNTVSVRLNNGSGSFGGGSEVTVGTNPFCVAAADLDNDGDLDLVAANELSNSVSVRLNNGSGVFTGSTELPVGGGPQTVAVADFNGDGTADLLTANHSSGNMSVLLNNGSGGFGAATSVSAGTYTASAVAADVDGDGDLDLLAANQNANSVSVALNNGSGGFGSASAVSVGSNPIAIATADVDGDGDLDLLTANQTGAAVSVRLNQNLAAPDLIVSTGSLGSPVAVAAGTYNSITVTGTGVGQLAGGTVVNSSVAVSGTLLTNCQPRGGHLHAGGWCNPRHLRPGRHQQHRWHRGGANQWLAQLQP